MKKILSIDGGGIRGIIPATVLAEIEERTGRSTARLFDLIAGTSTGGMIALGLGKPGEDGDPEFSARQLIELYARRGREIFSRSFWKGISSIAGLGDEKYPHQPIEQIFEEYYGETTLGSALTNLLISSYDIGNRTPFFFKSWRDKSRALKMSQVARATSAAPLYFEPALVEVQDKKLGMIDGGVFVNNPAVSAYAEARRIYPAETSFVVVSLGAGQHTRPVLYQEARDWGLIQWAIPSISMVFDGVSQAVDYQLNQILGSNFFRFQTELHIASDDLDNASQANIEALKMEARQLVALKSAELDQLSELLTQN